MRFVVYVMLVLACVLFLLIIFDTTQDVTKRACFGEVCFDVWVAQTASQQERGLMGVTSLDAHQGMLFVFSKEDNYTFWMKDTYIPLQMIWIDSNLEVVDISYAVPCERQPCQLYYPKEPAQFVLEVSDGLDREREVQIGDVLEMRA